MADIQLPSIRDKGFTVLVEGTDPIVDIVLVHGLQGHPKNTWTFGTPSVSKKRATENRGNWLARLCSCGSNKAGGKAAGSEILVEHTAATFWPADLLPADIPNSRVVTYGYDSTILHFLGTPTSQNTIYQHAKDMWFKFGELRVGCETRPIIFVAHSLGGILVKDVLRRSKGAEFIPEDRYIYPATRAILFLGTPHRGSSYADWGEIARRVASSLLMDTNHSLLNALQVDSGELDNIREEFAKMLRDPRLKIYSFQEAKGLAGVKGVNRKVVDDASSALDDAAETKVTINANHMNMCRFSSNEDSGYRDVASALGMCVKVIEAEIEAQRAKRLAVLDSEQKACLKTLNFDEWRNRKDGIGESYKSTLRWVDTNTILQDWMAGKAKVTWVSGKPGCGKSTIAKHLLGKMDAGCKIIAGFFFNDRGVELEKSEEGFLRAIVRQILRQIPSLFSHILQEYRERDTESDNPVVWSTEFLKKSLISMVHALDGERIWLVIDAVDECAESARDSILDLVDKLASAPSVHILITSRRDPIIVHRTSLHPTLQLDELVYDDIEIYIAGELDSLVNLNEQNSQAIEELHRMVLDKSQGVFLWVKLVVTELKLGTIKGYTIQELRAVIGSIPGDLEALYDRIYERLDSSRRDEARSILEWILFARRPLTRSEFRYALALGPGLGKREGFASSAAIETSDNVVGLARMDARLRDLCGGFLEIMDEGDDEEFQDEWNVEEEIEKDEEEEEEENESATGDSEDSEGYRGECYVQLIHQSVKEFLLKKRVPGENSASPWITEPSSHTHMAQDGPFLEYATLYWMKHAHLAHVCETTPQMGKLTQPGTRNFAAWEKSYQTVRWFWTAMEPPSPFEIAARWGLHADVKHFLEQGRTARLEILQGKTATSEIRRTGRQQLVTGHDEANVPFNAKKIHNDDTIIARDQANGLALGSAAFGGNCSVIQLLLDNGTDVNFEHPSGKCALFEAARSGQIDAAALLIKAGADVNFQGRRSRSVLYRAVESQHEKIVKLLLDAGADVNIARGRHGTALHEAVGARKVRIAQLLIDHGAELDIVCPGLTTPIGQPGPGRVLNDAAAITVMGPTTALRVAAMCGLDNIVQLLIHHGADLNNPCEGSGTALLAAAGSGMTSTVQLLLQHDAAVDRRCEGFETPLLAAVAIGHEEIVRLLLQHGADVYILGKRLEVVSSSDSSDQSDSDSIVSSIDMFERDYVGNYLAGIEDFMLPMFADLGDDRKLERQGSRTALFTAVEHGHWTIVQLLITHAADVNIPCDGFGTAFRDPDPDEEGDEDEIVQLLLDHGAGENPLCEGRTTALIQVAADGHQDTVRLLLAHGADVNTSFGASGTALVQAAACGHQETIQLLIAHGADINMLCEGFGTALILAASRGYQDTIKLFLAHDADDIVQLLLAYGAKVDILSEPYANALIQAAAEGHLEIVKLLLDHRAKIDISCDGFGTALLQAAQCGYEDIVELLITSGAKLDIVFEDMGTALIQAAAEGHQDIVQLLITRGADINISSDSEGSALVQAIAGGHTDIAQLLITHGANVNVAWDGGTPLVLAAGGGHSEIVQLLITHGADVKTSYDGFGTALHAAIIQWGDGSPIMASDSLSVNSLESTISNVSESEERKQSRETIVNYFSTMAPTLTPEVESMEVP